MICWAVELMITHSTFQKFPLILGIVCVFMSRQMSGSMHIWQPWEPFFTPCVYPILGNRISHQDLGLPFKIGQPASVGHYPPVFAFPVLYYKCMSPCVTFDTGAEYLTQVPVFAQKRKTKLLLATKANWFS